MTTMKVGDKAIWAEVKLGTSTRRFVLPSINGIVEKLRELLNGYENLFLVRHGECSITDLGAPVAGQEAAIPGLTYMVDGNYQGNLHGHSDNIANGTMRHSTDFINAILAQSGTYVAPVVQPPAPQEPVVQAVAQQVAQPPVVDPAAELRNRFAQQGIQPVVTQPVQQVVAPPVQEVVQEPTVQAKPVAGPVDHQGQAEAKAREVEKAQDALRQQLDKVKPVVPLPPAPPVQTEFAGYHDPQGPQYIIAGVTVKRIEEIHEMVAMLIDRQGVPGTGVTGKELGVWFNKSVADIGYDETFALLATKISAL